MLEGRVPAAACRTYCDNDWRNTAPTAGAGADLRVVSALWHKYRDRIKDPEVDGGSRPESLGDDDLGFKV